MRIVFSRFQEQDDRAEELLPMKPQRLDFELLGTLLVTNRLGERRW